MVTPGIEVVAKAFADDRRSLEPLIRRATPRPQPRRETRPVPQQAPAPQPVAPPQPPPNTMLLEEQNRQLQTLAQNLIGQIDSIRGTQELEEFVNLERQRIGGEMKELADAQSFIAFLEGQAAGEERANARRDIDVGGFLGQVGGSALGAGREFVGGALKGFVDSFTPIVPESVAEGLPNQFGIQRVGEALTQLTSPADIALTAVTAGLGPALLGSKAAAGPVARTLLAPLVKGGLGTRLAAETAAGVGAVIGAEEAAERAPGGTAGQIAAGLAGGLAGAVGGVGAFRGVQRAATQGPGAIADAIRPRATVFAATDETVGRTSIRDAQTGQPFEGRFLRGSGRETREGVFDEHFAQENIFGEGRNSTPSREFAEGFGPNLEEVAVNLQNPLVIKTDAEWRAITQEARLFSATPVNAEEVQRLRTVITGRGHDGVVIHVPDSEQTGKRLQQAFGDDTVVEFDTLGADVTARLPAATDEGLEAAGRQRPVQAGLEGIQGDVARPTAEQAGVTQASFIGESPTETAAIANEIARRGAADNPLQAARQNLDELEGILEGREAARTGLSEAGQSVPGGRVGLSDDALRRIAQAEQRDVLNPEDLATLDPVILREFRARGEVAGAEESITLLRGRARQARVDVRDLERESLANGVLDREIDTLQARINTATGPEAATLERHMDELLQNTAQPAPDATRKAAEPRPAPPPDSPPSVIAAETIQEQARKAPETIPARQAEFAHVETASPDGGLAKRPVGGRTPPDGPPTRPTAGGARGGPPEADPSDILRRAREQRLPGETLPERLVVLHESAIQNAARRARIEVLRGNKLLLKAKLGIKRLGSVTPATPEDIERFDALNNALHNPTRVASGEITVDPELRDFFDQFRGLTDFEQAARIDFDPNMATVDDYFYRGWKPPEEYATFNLNSQGQLVFPPSFRKPRTNATYQEMRDLGFEPLFWNPAEQWRASRMQGVRYREQMELVAALKESGDELIRAVPDAGIPEGFRVPRIGPAFEGKPFSAIDDAGESTVLYSRRWMTTDGIANVLENIYGVKPNLGTVHVNGSSVDLLKAIDWITFVPKRAKLFGSIFQQIDFANRQGIGAWSNAVDALSRGRPDKATLALFKLPRSMWEMLSANVRPGAAGDVLAKWDSTTPINRNRPGVTPKSISEAGLGQTDVTILPQDLDAVVREALEEPGLLNPKQVTRLVSDVEGAMRRGLFDRFYPATIHADTTRNIAPMMIRMYPKRTDAQLSAMIAEASNLKWSSIPASMSVVQNRFIRETLTRTAFSMAENEGLLRQAFRVIPLRGQIPRRGQGVRGILPVKISLNEQRFWSSHWVGAYLWLMTMASTIHFATTGEILPKDRWSPISKDNFGPLPFGYNTRFAAPDVPGIARGGFDATLDLVGQMDTAFRILDPQSFISSRTSVPVRALVNQVSGENFYGQDITTVGPGGIISRTEEAARDLFSPIGVGPLAEEAVRQNVPGADALIPAGESRLGLAGLAIQAASGTNLRAQRNSELWVMLENETDPEERDRITEELYRRDIESFDRNPTFEVDLRDPRTRTVEEWLKVKEASRSRREKEEIEAERERQRETQSAPPPVDQSDLPPFMRRQSALPQGDEPVNTLVSNETAPQLWETVSARFTSSDFQALDRVWHQDGNLTAGEEESLREVFNDFPFGQTNFNVWLKRTLRQVQENAAVQVAQV